MVFLWGWLAYAAPPAADEPADPVDLVDVRAFLDWHCSENNVPRYDGALTLAEAPPWVEEVEGRVGAWIEIGIDGLGRNQPKGDGPLAIAAEAPSSVVASALGTLARRQPADGRTEVLMARPGALAPRPPPPYGDVARIEDAEAQLRGEPHGDIPLAARSYLAAGRCREVVDGMWQRCAEAAAQLAEALDDRRCGMDKPEMIAVFAAHWGQGAQGVPIVRVSIPTRRAHRLLRAGTWGERAAGLLARLATEDPKPVPVFRSTDLAIEVRTPIRYPDTAFSANLERQQCLVGVSLRPDGVPFDVVVEQCNAAYHRSVRASVGEWRWEAPKIDDRPTKAKTWIWVEVSPP